MSLRRTLGLALSAGLLAVAPFTMAPAAQAAVAKPLDVVSIKYDPAGKDRRTNAAINQEYMVVKNTSGRTIDATGYRIKDAANHTFVFPRGTRIGAGKQVVIRTGKGTNSSTTLYWKQGNYVWNNTGDTLRLLTPQGRQLEKCIYRGGGSVAPC